jgi:DNA-directed RNA polymerase omega subunit
MARITIEDSLSLGYNKFELVHLVKKRVIELRRGKQLLVPTSNKEIVAALREIEASKVRLREGADLLPDGLAPDGVAADKVLLDDSAMNGPPDDSEGSEDADSIPGIQDEDSVDKT